MKRPFVALLAVFLAGQVGYVTWVAGYRAGYDDGATTAWDDARAALTPRERTSEVELSEFGLPPEDVR